ncbi:hypothetical protein Patl1_26796 [Pistacia atlantica]|uniref:Uncharacterized protein n=1 Tax=Pistacia atlantica TaxID=434234 RepID=A0ACC1AYT0_9ROSI|nr:hypothetical protein Patl1_26796 [Pistacia atlantica]
MKICFWIHFFFFFFIFFPTVFHISQSLALAFDEDKLIFRMIYRVHIINGFSNNDNPLIIHCYSKDDDLGEHSLLMNDEFKFKFGRNVWTVTRFVCDMRSGLKSKKIIVFLMGDEGKRCRGTGHCFWSIRDDGFYFCNDNKSWVKRYDW